MVHEVSGESFAANIGEETRDDDDNFKFGFGKVFFFSSLILNLLSAPKSFFQTLNSFLKDFSASNFSLPNLSIASDIFLFKSFVKSSSLLFSFSRLKFSV